MVNRYYPSKAKTGDLHDEFRLLFDHVYSLTDRLAKTQRELADMTERHDKLAQQVAAGPSNTKLLGFNVKAAVPSNGQKLTYVAASGDIEWQ